MNRTEKIILSSLLAAGSAAVLFGLVLRFRQSGEVVPFPYRIPEGGDVDELSETPEALFV